MTECEVLYDYIAEKQSDLPLSVGETVKIVSEEGVWWFGENAEGMRGHFPSNYVKKKAPALPPRPNEDRVLPSIPSAGKVDAKDDSDEESGDDDVVLAPPSVGDVAGPSGANRPMSIYGTPLENGHLDFATSVEHGEVFSIDSLDAFDSLMNNGYCMEKTTDSPTNSDTSIQVGSGDRVHIDCRAMTWDGAATTSHEFCKGEIHFTVGKNQVSYALDCAILLLHIGDKATITASPSTAYGAVGYPPYVPPNSHILYHITVLSSSQGDECANAAAEGPQPLLSTGSSISRPNDNESTKDDDNVQKQIIFVSANEDGLTDAMLKEAAEKLDLTPSA